MNANAHDPRSTSPSQGTVYVIVRNAGLSQSITRLLRVAGHEVETFTNAGEFLAKDFSAASCLLLGPGLSGSSGRALYDRIVATKAGVPVVFLGGRAQLHSAAQLGASGPLDFLACPFTDSELLAAVRAAVDRERSQRGRSALRQGARDSLARLTPRELQVCDLIVTGLLDEQIAAELGRAKATIRRHHLQIMRKLGVESVEQLAELVSLARQT